VKTVKAIVQDRYGSPDDVLELREIDRRSLFSKEPKTVITVVAVD